MSVITGAQYSATQSRVGLQFARRSLINPLHHSAKIMSELSFCLLGALANRDQSVFWPKITSRKPRLMTDKLIIVSELRQ